MPKLGLLCHGTRARLLIWFGLALVLVSIVACSETPPSTTAMPLTISSTAIPQYVPSAVYPKAGVEGVPSSVNKLSVAVDTWGANELNPWALTDQFFLQDYFNMRLMTEDENGFTRPLWAEEFEIFGGGIRLKLNDQAKFQDGQSANAETLRTNIRGLAGLSSISWWADEFGALEWLTGPYNSGTLASGTDIENVRVEGEFEIFIPTPRPTTWIDEFGGTGHHLYWYANPDQLLKGEAAYLQDPKGGGPYRIEEWEPDERILLERWENYWADYPWHKKPQHRLLEIIKVPDDEVRLALLQSGGVDMVYNVLPWKAAVGLNRSENTQRGINPSQGNLWTQQYLAAGHTQLTFPLPSFDRAGLLTDKERNDPTMNLKVREALMLAIDQKAIADEFHSGGSTATSSIYSLASFGFRDSVGYNIRPYDPEGARELLSEAGYADGFDIDAHWSRISSATGLSLMPKAISDYWAAIGVKVNFIEHEQPHFIDLINKRSLKPVVLQTFRRQANSGQRVFVTYLFNALYPSAWDEEINDLAAKILTSLDTDEQLKLMAELEDKVLSLKETFPIYAMSRINAYSDRVLAHPTPAYARHFLDLDRIILRN